MKQILFLGHSVLYFFPEDMLDNWRIVNMSINGGIAKEGFKNLKEASLDLSTLDTVLIMFGINELHYRFKATFLLENIKNILNYLETESFKGRIILSTIMRGWEEKRYDNTLIDLLNEELEKIACKFKVDLFKWDSFYNAAGKVPPIYSSDGIHLTTKGYQKFKDQLMEILKD